MEDQMQSVWCLVKDVLDDSRAAFNRSCSHFEAWQLVFYTISFCFLVGWLRRAVCSELTILERFRWFAYSSVRSLPWVRRRVIADLEKLRQEVEEETHQWDKQRDFYKFLPERALTGEEIIAEARQYASMGERRFMEHYDPKTRSEDLRVSSQVLDLFSHSDPHRSDAFPGARKMEAEIVRMNCAMFHGGSESCGVVSGGGTESTLLACLAYRNRALARGAERPELLAPETAHASLEKAACMFGMRVRRIPVDSENKADVSAMKAAIGMDTCMIVASAPNHLTGTIDPIEKLSELALASGIPLHIDATLGGFILPFMEYCDFGIQSFDFRLPGVSSIAVDMHRYGQCPRSCSVLMYREQSLMRHQCFINSKWAGGLYGTPTLAGGRDGGAIATAWATLLRKGRDGYLDACQRVVNTTRKLTELLNETQLVEIKGSADICIVAFSCTTVNTYAVVDKLIKKGWHVDALLSPNAARVPVTLSMDDSGIIESFVEDVVQAIKSITDNPGFVKTSKLTSFYEMLQKVSDRSLLNELYMVRIQAHFSVPQPLERRSMRSLSVEGRKMSMMMAADAARALQEVRERKEKDSEDAII